MSTTVYPPTVTKRNGSQAAFNRVLIEQAVLSTLTRDAACQPRTKTVADPVGAAKNVTDDALRHLAGQENLAIEAIQDAVEQALMAAGLYQEAKDYILVRNRKQAARVRLDPASYAGQAPEPIKMLALSDRRSVPCSVSSIRATLMACAMELTSAEIDRIAQAVYDGIFPGMAADKLQSLMQLVVAPMIEMNPIAEKTLVRLKLQELQAKVFGAGDPKLAGLDKKERHGALLCRGLARGIEIGLVNPKMVERFNLGALKQHLDVEIEDWLTNVGVSTLIENYLLVDKTGPKPVYLETPVTMFMRVAMGLALNEDRPTDRAIEFYQLYASRRFCNATPTLFNAGTTRPQLASCFLTTVADSLQGIYGGITRQAMLQKHAGGVGMDWTPVRGLGAHIHGTNGASQGVIPFLKVSNDTVLAVNQGGKRKGAACAYLETWHIDVEEFLQLRKNTGDDRRRTHDMNTANWVPDLFMKRAINDLEWTLFSPEEVPDLHDLHGQAFESAYEAYERAADEGRIRVFKRVSAKSLWRSMLTMLFETGHPWITFKDPCNAMSPQSHVGVVHGSNLCTEITLNTSDDEIAVCNLGSVNVAEHVTPLGEIMHDELRLTVMTAVRMLDNVIDLNMYTQPEAKNANTRHRPLGLGVMGLQDAFHKAGFAFDSEQAIMLNAKIMESVALYSYESSADLANERGSYSSFEGSAWSRGVTPAHAMRRFAELRGGFSGFKIVDLGFLNWELWDALGERTKLGMRNSLVLAIAPTATIANIMGCSASTEPMFGCIAVKSNLAGEYTVVNPYLHQRLKALNLWTTEMVQAIKSLDGSIQTIEAIPKSIRDVFKTAFEISPSTIIQLAASRQWFIDQAQSTNLYIAKPSGKLLDETYTLAWLAGLKTTYYLRSLSSSGAEKSTTQAGSHNAVPVKSTLDASTAMVCSMEEGCIVCQ